MEIKTKLQDDPEVLAYMFHNPLKGKDGTPVLHDGKAIIFGSPVYLGVAAEGMTFSDVNKMVSERQATCFVNGAVTIWKVPDRDASTGSSRPLA